MRVLSGVVSSGMPQGALSAVKTTSLAENGYHPEVCGSTAVRGRKTGFDSQPGDQVVQARDDTHNVAHLRKTAINVRAGVRPAVIPPMVCRESL